MTDLDVTNTGAITFAELDAGRGGREAAVRDGNIFANARRAPAVLGDQRHTVVTGLDSAIGDRNIAATVEVDAVGPNRFLQAGKNVEPFERGLLTIVKGEGPDRRVQEVQPGES